MKTAQIQALIAIGFLGLTACAPAKFSMNGLDSNGNPTVTSTGGPPVICDPFDSTNIISATSGLQGSIYYLDASQPRYTNSIDYINNGHKVNADLFMNSVNVPTRIFSYGFVTDGGLTLVDNSNQLLVEYFGLKLDSKIKLGASDDEGDYQLALLADDGATLSLDDGSGTFQQIVGDEGEHPTQFACASHVLSMDRQSRIPIDLTYFQGPRYHIALMMLWRKISAPQSLSDKECGNSGNDYFFSFDQTTGKSVAQPAYLGLLMRGWKPLSAENFELQSGSNKCATTH